MTQAQLEVRKERSENDALIASATAEGFRVYAAQNPSKVYLVKQEGEQWTCTCPDFEFHKADSTWRCKHVLAVAPWPKTEETLPVEVEFDDPTQGLNVPEPPAPDQVRRKRVRKEARPGNGQASAIPAAAGGENLPPVQEKTLVQAKSGPPKPATQKTRAQVGKRVGPDVDKTFDQPGRAY
jgi:predicted nucleic acid-binding Zn finger protein